jgi:thiaminase/transcriptional activator TenA
MPAEVIAFALHEMLWRANADLVEACSRHHFVRELADGTLDPDAFRRYVGQDAFFLRAFGRGYALAAARALTLDDVAAFHGLLGGVLDELRLHQAYAVELGIDLERVDPLPETRAYTNFLLSTGWGCGLGDILTAMTPCMRLYAHLGRQLAARSVPQHRYHRWIEAYSAPSFADLSGAIEALLDRHAADTASVRATYRYALLCEQDFFSAALRA